MNSGLPILTAQAMRDAEQAAVASGTSLATLMDRAGESLAQMVWRVASGRPIRVLAGPGNNGGDGYVAARHLAALGATVDVAVAAPPATDLAMAAASRWTGATLSLSDRPQSGAILVDCLFGTGLSRSLETGLRDSLAAHASAASRIVAADLPSGVDSDTGADRGCPFHADLTVAFGALKPAHLLFPAAARMGRVVVADIGIAADSSVRTAAMPPLAAPTWAAHKYARGLVAVVAGVMGGAAELAARAALRAGSGYVRLVGSALPPTPPHAIVRQGWRDGAAIADDRIGAIVIGCGLGQGDSAAERVAAALASGKPLVIDADALAMVGPGPFRQPTILTPHPGEFARLAPDAQGDKIRSTLSLATRLHAVVIHKGADTVIAAPDGRVALASPGSAWLSTAGTGDVLAGVAGAMLARGLHPFDAAQAAVLLHQRAAARLPAGFAADDLLVEPLWP